MVDLLATFGVPLSIGGVVALFVQTIIVALIIIIVNKFIGSELEIKSGFIMALGAYFIVPLVFTILSVAGINLPYFYLIGIYVIPLIVWIALSEVLLHSQSSIEKAKVGAVSFVAYTILQMFGIVGMIINLLPI